MFIISLSLMGLFSLPAFSGPVLKLDANESAPFWSASLPGNGMCGEIVQAMSKAADVEASISFKPLKRMIENDANNDLGNPAFFMKNQEFSAVIPIAVYHVSIFYYLPNQPHDSSAMPLEHLKNHKVGLLKGTLVDRSSFEQLGIQFEESYSHQSMFKKLRKGRLDMVIEVDLIGQQIIRNLFPDEVEQFGVAVMPRSDAPIAVLLAENQPDSIALGKRLRDALQQVRDNGEYQRILDKYYSSETLPKNYFNQLDRFSYLYAEAEE
ncbi:polar amino acid transport system substrate-binding protein [Mariprofundus micogutta]|uniref:Polar amino acid transport system substrate-binding protein n=1 Tax=Mariprofundus micogutta TaxID=1921010 RepID=A0A1L8CN87_9PROT|nr:transporter substrate-binding domain-containing protein [Mariprofundus micogutta]GAV20375.1 polar amino acid transport system substrate-binding protein [Mariprofundus micogutta]